MPETLRHFSPIQTVACPFNQGTKVSIRILFIFPTFHLRLYLKNLETVNVYAGFLSNRFRVKWWKCVTCGFCVKLSLSVNETKLVNSNDLSLQQLNSNNLTTPKTHKNLVK